MAKKRTNSRGNALPRLIVVLVLIAVAGWALWQSPPVERIFYPFPNRALVDEYAHDYGVDPLLVIAVIREESRFLPQSESRKGALGLMQLMPATASSIAHSLGDKGYRERDLLEPEKKIQYGTWYLASLEKEFSGNVVLTMAAYNAGKGHVRQWIRSGQIDPKHVQVGDIPFGETREYVLRVLKSYQKYIMLYKNP